MTASEDVAAPFQVDPAGRLQSWLGGRPAEIVAIVALSSVGAFSLAVLPAAEIQLAAELHRPAGAIGTLLASEGLAGLVSTLAALIWLRRVAPRRISLAAGTLFLLANLGSALAPSYDALLLLRPLAGFAGGTLVVACLAIAGRSANTDRVYGWWIVGQTVSGSLGLFALPALFAHWGIAALYLLMAGAMAVVLPSVRALSGTPAHGGSATTHHVPRTPRRHAARYLVALCLFYLSIGGAWAFAGDCGEAEGVAAATVTSWLAGANLLGLVGSVLAGAIGRPERRRILILAGELTLAAGLALFVAGTGTAAFATATVLLQLAWCFTAPLLLSLIAALDPTGRLMAAGNLLLGTGLAAGPAVAGYAIQVSGEVRSASIVGLVALLVSAVLLGYRPGRAADIAVP